MKNETPNNYCTATDGKPLVSGCIKKTSWRGEKCFHCESANNNTERMGVRTNGSEEWKCYDCGRWFVLSEYSR